MKDNREKKYTSTSNKLFNHLGTMAAMKLGKYFPINLQVAPTNKCNMKCEFCSVRDRPNDELEYQTLIESILKFKNLGLKSVEITGGGEPTLYKNINNLIGFCALGLQVGLITNGTCLNNLTEGSIKRLSWLRVSLSMLDFDINYKYDLPKERGNCTLGLSYVWHKESKFEIIDKVYDIAKEFNVKYVRLVPDCLDTDIQDYVRTELKDKIKELGYDDKIFIQAKPYDVYSPCRIGAFKPFLNADGYLYHCSAVPLYHRKFSPEWQICHMSEIDKIWPDGFKPFCSEICKKGKCFYSEQNKILDEMCIEVDHSGFI